MRFLRPLSVVIAASLIAIVFALAQVSGPDSGVSTNCGVSGVDRNGVCLNAPGGPGVSTGTQAGGGGGGCSNKLDFSQPCNSQYIGIVQ